MEPLLLKISPDFNQPGLLRVAALACGAADQGKGSSPQHVTARLTQLQVWLPPLDMVEDKAGVRNRYLHVLARLPPAPRLRGCLSSRRKYLRLGCWSQGPVGLPGVVRRGLLDWGLQVSGGTRHGVWSLLCAIRYSSRFHPAGPTTSPGEFMSFSGNSLEPDRGDCLLASLGKRHGCDRSELSRACNEG